MVVGGNGDSIYSRLMSAVGRQDMAADNPDYADNSRRCERETEIMEVRAMLSQCSAGGPTGAAPSVCRVLLPRWGQETQLKLQPGDCTVHVWHICP